VIYRKLDANVRVAASSLYSTVLLFVTMLCQLQDIDIVSLFNSSRLVCMHCHAHTFKDDSPEDMIISI